MLKTKFVAAAVLTALAIPANADGDAAKGERIFNKCKGCHAVGEDAKNKVGPILNGIVDAPAAENPDYKYSDALLQLASDGLVWDEETLGAFLRDPKEVVPGTKMSFPGLRKDDEIANVIAYLETQ